MRHTPWLTYRWQAGIWWMLAAALWVLYEWSVWTAPHHLDFRTAAEIRMESLAAACATIWAMMFWIVYLGRMRMQSIIEAVIAATGEQIRAEMAERVSHDH